MKAMIGVIGASGASAREARWAREVGRLIARRGAVLVCGGLGGVMREAARGAKEEGGLTVGIIPGERASSANRFIDIPIVTGMGYARNIIVVRSSRAVIAVGGSYGTLSEIAYCLNLGVPLVALGAWEIEKIDRRKTPLVRAATPEQAVEEAFRIVAPGGG